MRSNVKTRKRVWQLKLRFLALGIARFYDASDVSRAFAALVIVIKRPETRQRP